MESPSTSYAGRAAKKGEGLPQFAAVLAQIQCHEIAPLASFVRRSMEVVDDKSNSSINEAPWHGCNVSPEPLHGSYNLAYLITFEDGVQWMLKVPANGHSACFDRVAAEALRSEALTMQLIRQMTSIPVPTVYHFEASLQNIIGCPFILMDILKGKPLWQGWFDEESPKSSVEQFRARSMQTIAAAMVQLSQFTVERGGFLRFDHDGLPVGVTTARVPDWLAGSDIKQGVMTAKEGCLYCEKGPIADPFDSFMFMLDRRGVREGDGPLESGSYEIVRMFTEWTLKQAENANGNRKKFVLAHPDFAVQNFLVEDDGTLCGIIDWDGVAAVPLSIGCLKYPDWLMSDWHPSYDYSPGVPGQLVDSREDLTIYRTMYAQFVEASSTVVCGSSRAGKLNADITRRSLIAGTLDVGAQDPELTNAVIDIIFQHLERLTADDDDGEMSDTGLDSENGTGTNDVSQEESGGETAPTETEERARIDEKDANGDGPCSKSTAGPVPQSPPIDRDDESDESRPPKSHTPRLDGFSSGPKLGTTSSANRVYIEKKARDQKKSVSRRVRLAKWALSLGERGSKRLADSLHKKESIKSKPSRKVKAIQRALNIGEKCCRGASEAFHKKDAQQSLPVQKTFEPIPATTVYKRIRTPQSRLLKPITMKLIDDDASGVQTPEAAQTRSSTNGALLNEQHCQGCDSPSKDSGAHESLSNDMQSPCMYPQDVWASIAAEVGRGGIPIDLIQKRRDLIVQCVIQTLGKESQREKDTNSHTNAYSLTDLKSIEDANQELRTILSSCAEPHVPSSNPCSKSVQDLEAHAATKAQINHAKAERLGEDFETSESDKQELWNISSSPKRPEAATTDPRKEMIQVAEIVSVFCESKDQYQLPATESVFNADTNIVFKQAHTNFRAGRWMESSEGIVKVQTPTNYERGWWIETDEGSLKRIDTGDALLEKDHDQKLNPKPPLAISNHQLSKTVNKFRVPDDDDDSTGDYDGGVSLSDEYDREDHRLKDGERDAEVSGYLDNEAKSESKGPMSRFSNEDKAKHERKAGNNSNKSNFNSHDVRVALGKGKIGERRMRRLKRGFMALLDDVVGEYRRKK